MEYTHLGRSGVAVSRLCLGTMNFGAITSEADAQPIMDAAHEHGINFLDTSNTYGQPRAEGVTESVIGRWLAAGSGRRDRTVLATKLYGGKGDWPNDRFLSALNIRRACEDSLRRLGTDHIDLYQIHRWDDATPVEETMRALDDLVRAGKVRYLGASSMYAWQFAKAQYTARAGGWTEFVSMQNLYNLAYREEEREMIPLCRDLGAGVLPYSPLARGLLTGSRTRDGGRSTARGRNDPLAEEHYTEDDFMVVDALAGVARARGVPPAQVALAWLLGRPGVTAPIVGVTRPGHLEDAVAALDLVLDDAEVELLEAGYRPHRVLGHS
jgi:aryl-alcohol dehydrogenase-like predicted oxidoreductase